MGAKKFFNLFILKFAVLALLFPCSFAWGMGAKSNLGHRAGGGLGEAHPHLPENSLIALKVALIGERGLPPIQDKEQFVYLEFDIQETWDHELVVFHDTTLPRIIHNDSINRNAIRNILKDPNTSRRVGKSSPEFSDLKIQHLTLNQLRTLKLNKVRTETIPTMKEFLEKAHIWNLRKPMAAEIKYIYSDKGRWKYLQLLRDFRQKQYAGRGFTRVPAYDMDRAGANLLAFESAFAKSFGEPKTKKRNYWCNVIADLGFEKVYRSLKHSVNLCE